MRKKHELQQVFYKASQDKWLHRCPVCWVDVDRNDNGYKDLTKPYPHAGNCPLKGKF